MPSTRQRGERRGRPFLLGGACLVLLAACAAPKPPPPPAPTPSLFVLLPEQDGGVGQITITNPSGTQVLNQSRQASAVPGATGAPGSPFVLDEAQIRQTFGEALAALPPEPVHFILYFKGDSDDLTPESLLRTQQYMQALCEDLATHRRFRDFLTADTMDLVARLAPIHDIGKVGVRDLILRKAGPLTEAEWGEMRRHPDFGHQVIADAELRARMRDDALLRLAKDVVSTHHEWWNGTGYPRGLKGEEIPVAGRLVAVVDVYDALVSKRVYKPRLPHDVAVGMIVDERGTHFDPDVVDAVLRIQERWRRILLTLGDEGTDTMHP